MEKLGRMVQVAVLGCGSRSVGVVANLLKDSGHNVRIASVFDPDESEMERALGYGSRLRRIDAIRSWRPL